MLSVPEAVKERNITLLVRLKIIKNKAIEVRYDNEPWHLIESIFGSQIADVRKGLRGGSPQVFIE